jgi:hypothetical protein
VVGKDGRAVMPAEIETDEPPTPAWKAPPPAPPPVPEVVSPRYVPAVETRTVDLGGGRMRTQVRRHPQARGPAMSLAQLASRRPRR